MTARCDQCKHWNDPDEYYRDVGLCVRIPQFWDRTTWDDSGERVVKQEYVDTLAFVQDGSDYSAHLFTKPEFFCAHFEAK